MKKITEYRIVQSVIAYCHRVTFPGFQGMPISKVMAFFFKSLSKGILQHRAAAMTYRVFFALIPLMMTLFAAISFLGSRVRNTILDFIQTMVPEYVWPAIQNMIEGVINKQNGTLLSISLIFSIFTVFLSINKSVNILNTTYFNTGKRKLLKQLRVISMLVVIWLAIILLAVGVFIAASAYLRHIDRFFFDSPQILTISVHIAKWLLLYALIYMFISVFYYLAPAKRQHFKFFSAGSTFATVAMVLVLAGMNIYFSNFGNYNALYGSLGAVFAILLWLYWNSMFILVGYDLNVSIATAKSSMLIESAHQQKSEKK